MAVINPDTPSYEFDITDMKVSVMLNENELGLPVLSLFQLTPEELNRLGDGYSYTAQTYIKRVLGNSEDELYVDLYKNFRIGVFNNAIQSNIGHMDITNADGELETIEVDFTDYTNLTIQEIYSNAEYWSEYVQHNDTFESLTCNFMYDEKYPVYIIITGEYIDYGDAENNTVEFSKPCLVETARYNGYETEGLFAEPINNMVSAEDISLVNLAAFTQTNPLIVYDFPLDESFGTDELQAVRGISVSGNIEYSDEITLYAKLVSPEGKPGQRSIVLTDNEVNVDGDTSFTIGGIGDLWGFNTLELTDLDKWQVELVALNNINDNEANFNFNDVKITFYIENIDVQNINIKVEGEDLSLYNAFITDVVIPPGLESDIDFLTVDGTDTNDAYRQSISEKVIELEFEVGDSCNVNDNTTILRQVIKLLTTQKDKYNRPIPKRIEFSHYPDVYFEYVLEDSPSATLEVNSYNVKAKLKIPSGTAYSKEDTVTSSIGYVQGLCSVEPIIRVKCLDTTIEIRETVTGQKFNMGYTGDWSNGIVEIDCEDHVVYLKENADAETGEDITAYCDFNVDWFRLYGEFAFEGTNCIIQTVQYTERW